MADDGDRREIWIIAIATVAVVAAGLGYFGWDFYATRREREAMSLPTLDLTDTGFAARERAGNPPKRPSTEPATPAESLPTIVFADGTTTARVTKIERFRGDDPNAPRPPGVRGGMRAVSDEDTLKQTLRVTVEFKDAQPQADQDHVVKIDGRRTGASFGNSTFRGDSRAMIETVVVVDTDVDRVAIDVAAAVGPFTESQRIAVGDGEARQLPSDQRPPTRIVDIRKRPNSTLVLLEDGVADTRPSTEQSWVMQAVLRDGRRVLPNSISSGSLTGRRIAFPAEAKDVDYVIFRYRPYEWRTLGEVALPPIAATQPTTVPNAGR